MLPSGDSVVPSPGREGGTVGVLSVPPCGVVLGVCGWVRSYGHQSLSPTSLPPSYSDHPLPPGGGTVGFVACEALGRRDTTPLLHARGTAGSGPWIINKSNMFIYIYIYI